MRILEIELLCNSIEKVEKFYGTVMGFQVLVCDKKKISFQTGESILTFRLDETARSPIYHFAFNIPPNQLAEGLNWIRTKAQIIPASENKIIVDFDNWNAKSVYFFDDSGNILELIARYDLPDEGSGKFSSQSILCISEIAIATGDVFMLSEEIMSSCGLSLYSRQPRLENFAAIGDANGLLIVSKSGRNWYPTEIPSGEFYTRIVLEVQGKKAERVFNG